MHGLIDGATYNLIDKIFILKYVSPLKSGHGAENSAPNSHFSTTHIPLQRHMAIYRVRQGSYKVTNFSTSFNMASATVVCIKYKHVADNC